MTGDDVDTDMRAIGLAWQILGGEVCDATELKVAAFSEWCNVQACDAYAAAANKANLAEGVDLTATDVAAIVRLYVGDPKTDPPTPGDPSQLRALLSGS